MGTKLRPNHGGQGIQMRRSLVLMIFMAGTLVSACGGGASQSQSYNDGFSYIEAQPQSVRDNVACDSAIVNAPSGDDTTQWAQGCAAAEGGSPFNAPGG